MTRRNMLGWVIAGVLCLGWADVSLAQSKRPERVYVTPAASTTVEVLVVHATPDGPVDSRLGGLVDNLRSSRFNGFELLSHDKERLGDGEVAVVSLAGDSKLEVSVVGRARAATTIRVQILSGRQATWDSTMSIPNGKYVLFAGPDHGDGKLMIPVGVATGSGRSR